MTPSIHVAWRYDDFSNGSPSELERFLFGTAARHGIPFTVGVVPWGSGPEDSRPPNAPVGGAEAPLRPEKAEVLHPHVERGEVEVALHGWDHRPVGTDPRGRPAEFSGQPASVQRERIERGARLLGEAFGRRPRTFIPPWNRFDGGTLTALDESAFQVLSGGRDGAVPTGGTVRVVPATAVPTELEVAVNVARRMAGAPVLVVVLWHPYDFRELGKRWGRIDREETVRAARWLRDQPDVRAATLSGLAELGAGEEPERWRRFVRLHQSPLRRLQPHGRAMAPDRPLLVYPPVRDLRRHRRRLTLGPALRLGAVALVGALVGWAAGALLARGPSWALPGARWAAGAGVVSLAILAFRGDGPYFRGAALLTAGAAFTAGLWLF